MKRLLLASSVETTGPAIGKEIGNPKSKKLAFIYTAGELHEDNKWIDEDREGLIKAGFNLVDYTITGKNQNDFDRELGGCDVIHVNGGNTFYLLYQARKSGFDIWIKKEVNEGRKIYTGSSAGSMLVSPNIEIGKNLDRYDYGKELKTFESIDLVDFIILPHWGSDHFRDRYLNYRLEFAFKPENKIILLNDWQYVKVEGDTYKIVDIRD